MRLFSRDVEHTTRLRASTLGHWFATLAADSGHPDVTLHRLRRTVATTLVERGDLLQAQHRLGHRDASTTLRIYSHAMPLTDANAADALDSSTGPPDRRTVKRGRRDLGRGAVRRPGRDASRTRRGSFGVVACSGGVAGLVVSG